MVNYKPEELWTRCLDNTTGQGDRKHDLASV